MDAVAAGARLLCLPEAFAFLGSSPDETVAQAEALDGPRIGAYRALARTHRLWLSLGGYHEAPFATLPVTSILNSARTNSCNLSSPWLFVWGGWLGGGEEGRRKRRREAMPDGSRVSNTHLILDADGATVADEVTSNSKLLSFCMFLLTF